MPGGPWGATWALALALAAGALAASTYVAPARGFTPSVKDGPGLWSAYRARADTPTAAGAPVVLAGSSRFMLGIDPAVVGRALGRPALELAIDGSDPFLVLDDLADDESFHGIVLCELGAFIKEGSLAAREGAAKPDAYLRYFHARAVTSDAEARAREWVQSQLVVLVPELSPRQLVLDLLARHAVRPSYVHMLPGRLRRADYGQVDVAAHRRHWLQDFGDLGPTMTDAEVAAFADQLGAQAARIRARGGQVVFFRMVSSGGVRALEDAHTPRAQWDLFAARVGAPSFHYEDVPALRGFVAADDSHLDGGDVERFSAALGAELARRGLGRPSSPEAAAQQ